MHLIGRWERVRSLDVATRELSPPMLLDRKWNTLRPEPSVLRALRDERGAFLGRQQYATPGLSIASHFVSTYSQSTLILDSSYTFNSAGDVIFGRLAGIGKTLSKVYFFLTASSGTAANINDINFELRNDNGSGTAPNRASPTLHTSGSMDPNSDASFTGWHQIDPADFTMVNDTLYWLAIADADGNGTDKSTVLRGLLSNTSEMWLGRALYCSFDAGNGASTNPTARNEIPSIVIEWSDATVTGWSASASAAATSNTERKGLYLSDGLTETLSIWGAWFAGSGGGVNGLEVYDGSTNPGGSTLASGTRTILNGSGTVFGASLSSPYTLAKATAYRVVFTYGSSNGEPRKLSIGTDNGHTTVLRKARLGGSGWYYAWANGTTNWANDDQDAQPHMGLLIEDQVAVAGGGGAHRVIGASSIVVGT